MKKLLCLVMMLCLMATAAFAEEALTLDWETGSAVVEASGLTGEFYTFEDLAVAFWVPEGLEPVELTEEDVANGYIAYFMPEDQSAALAFVYVDVNGLTVEDYATYLTSETDAQNVEIGTVNGLNCVSYTMPEKDTVNIMFATEAGYALEVTCWPLSEENAELVWGVVVSSIQAVE